MLSKFKNNDFVKSVSVLMTGTILSQIVNYAFTPILSRIYTVEEMADLGLYLRISAFIVGIATARFEMTLPLPKNDTHSFLLYRMSVQISLYIMLLVGIIASVYVFIRPFSWFNIWFLLLVISGSAFTVMINLGTNWSIRNNTFHLISRSRIINAFASNALKLGFGFLKFGSIGLLLGTVLGYIASSFQFLKEYLLNRTNYKKFYSKVKQRILILEYKQFPLVNLPHSLSDLGRDLLIASLIVFSFGKEVFGWYSYSVLMLNIPVALIGVAISQVFYNRAAKMVNEGHSVYSLVKKTILTLFLLSVIPFGVLHFFSEQLFMLVLGEKWKMAGTYAEIMVFYNLFNFLVSPMANLSLVLNRQKEFFVSALINSAGQVLILFIFPFLLGNNLEDFTAVLWILTIFQSFMMLVNAFLYLKYSKSERLK